LYLNNLGCLISDGIIEGNVQDGLGYGKLMHGIFWTNVSFHELLPQGMAGRLLNQGNGLKSMKKRGERSTFIEGALSKLAGTGKKYYN
jgi:hypothetical protein